MTREEARKAAEVMMAYADGKDVEYRLYGDNKWETFNGNDKGHLILDFFNYIYRIKKEPTYRPFKNKEECWAEMQKHQPFGWVIKDNAFYDAISAVGNNLCRTQGGIYEYEESFTHFTFADGTPFGIKEE